MNITPFKKEYIVPKMALAAVVTASALLLSGCSGKGAPDNTADIPADTMLVDYYRSTAAVENDGYYELVLYTTETADTLKLCIYSKDSADTDEVCTTYLVPYKVAQDCSDIIKKHRLDSWDSLENPTSLDGALTVCKFYSDGGYIRISTEKMPSDGDKILDSMGSTLQAYATADRLVPDSTEV